MQRKIRRRRQREKAKTRGKIRRDRKWRER